MNERKLQKTQEHIEIISQNIDAVLDFLGVGKTTSPLKEADEGAKQFYELYHNLTGKKKTDWELVKKEWRKMGKKERKLALDSVYLWAQIHHGKDTEYIKKCWKYLKDKNFNDEMTGNGGSYHYR